MYAGRQDEVSVFQFARGSRFSILFCAMVCYAMHEVLLLNTTMWLRTAEDLGSPVKTFLGGAAMKGGAVVDIQGSQGHGMEPCNCSR